MPKTKGIERTVDKYGRRAGVARPDYLAGVLAPKEPWAASTIAAKDTFRDAITDPSVPELYAAGARAAGDERWQGMCEDKGADRYSKGVELGKPYYKERMGDVIGVIERTSLTRRGPAGSETNYNRSKEMGVALRAWKLARKSS